jgi:O-antigen/teichoic acid export membrane protein
MSINATAKAACAASPAGNGDSSPKTALLTTAWLMARRWKGRIFFAVLDQGFASTANFLLTILCVVWLPLDAFGRYVIVWSISLLVEIAQISLVLDTMPAIVARYGQRNRRRLDVAGLWVVLIYGALTSVLIVASVPGFMYWAPEFVLPILCLAAANPFQRLYVFLRRLCYIRDRQDAAAAAAFAYGVTLLGGACVLFLLGLLSVHAVVLTWGLANGVAVAVIYLMGLACPGRLVPAQTAWLARELWRSGRWLFGAAIGNWVTTWGMLPLVAATAGLETAGVIRALQNLFTPIIQFNAALNLAVLPRVADKVVTAGRQYARSFAIYSTALFLTLVLVYAGLVMSEAKTILSLLYRKPEITAGAYLLWPLGLAMILESARQGSTMALLSLSVTRTFFVSRVVAVSVFVVGVLTLGRIWSAEGILWAYAMSHAAGTALVVYAAFYRLGPHAGTASLVPPRPRKREAFVRSPAGTPS